MNRHEEFKIQFELLKAFLEEQGCQVTYLPKLRKWKRNIRGQYNHISKKISIEPRLYEHTKLCVLIHEAAHFLDAKYFSSTEFSRTRHWIHTIPYLEQDCERLAYYVQNTIASNLFIPNYRVHHPKEPEGHELDNANQIMDIITAVLQGSMRDNLLKSRTFRPDNVLYL